MQGLTLASYVSLIGPDTKDTQLSITLVAGGARISGKAVSHEAWLQEYKKGLQENGMPERLVEAVSRPEDVVELDDEARANIKDSRDTEIYLLDAYIGDVLVGPIIVDRTKVAAWSPMGISAD